MGIVTKLQRAFGGGVGLAMDLPPVVFAWEDRVIPLNVHLTSRQSQSDPGA